MSPRDKNNLQYGGSTPDPPPPTPYELFMDNVREHTVTAFSVLDPPFSFHQSWLVGVCEANDQQFREIFEDRGYQAAGIVAAFTLLARLAAQQVATYAMFVSMCAKMMAQPNKGCDDIIFEAFVQGKGHQEKAEQSFRRYYEAVRGK